MGKDMFEERKKGMSNWCLLSICTLMVAFVFGSCANETQEESQTGEAHVALTQIPSDVQCVRIKVIGANTTVRKIAVESTEDAQLDLGRLPIGEVTFEGNAYDSPCNDLALANLTYIADSVDTILRAGVSENVELDFRANDPVIVSANFKKSVDELIMGSYTTAVLLADGTMSGRGIEDIPSGLSDIRLADLGLGYGCIVKDDETLWCWGRNYSGQAGVDPNVRTWIPVTQIDLTGLLYSSETIVQLSMNYSTSCFNTSSSRAFCWGANTSGQLGIGTDVSTHIPTQITVPYSFPFIESGNTHTCSFWSTGGVMCAGDNRYGQFGDGTTTNNTNMTNTRVRPAKKLALGYWHTCMATVDGGVSCWGRNQYGQLGDGSTDQSTTPVEVSGLSGITDVKAGRYHTCALDELGDVYCWGNNDRGQAGAGGESWVLSPHLVLHGATQLQAGDSTTCALMEDLEVLCWGSNTYHQIADGDTSSKWEPFPTDVW